MSELIARLPIRQTLAGRWQAPLLLVGMAVLGLGIHQMAASQHASTLDNELARVRRLREADALPRASTYLMHLMLKPKRPIEEMRVLHAEMASVIHLAESRLKRHNPRNIDAIVAHSEEARHLGIVPDARYWSILGDALQWSGQDAKAIAAYRKALKSGARPADRLHRTIAEWAMSREGIASADVIDQVDAVLADGSATPGNYLWALEQKVQTLLAAGDTAEAMRRVAEGRDRLSGTEFLLAASYCEALCLREAGLRMEAEDLLRMLREEWSLRDELWAKAGWLLGRLQQEDERPQAALSFYEEVLKAFQQGEVHDLCMLGQAECLAALQRFDEAYDLFMVLKDRLLDERPPCVIDREIVRVGVSTIAEELILEGRLETAVNYLDLARALAPNANHHWQSYYVARQAAVLEEMAQKAEAGGDHESLAAARRCHLRAAETSLALTKLVLSDDAAFVNALDDAADSFEAAGEPDRAVEILERLIREFPQSPERIAALHRIAIISHSLGDLDRAVENYERIIDWYPRTPQSLQCYVPLADCLIRRGGDRASEGVKILLDIVDDRGEEPMFTPQAAEYRLALLRLCDYFVEADPEHEPGHVEKAIARLEDAIAFYPDDPQAARLRFLLAESYRASSEALDKDAKELASDLARRDARLESDRRMVCAMEAYQRVIGLLAGVDTDALTPLETTWLRASYQYRGDCLFDLGRYEDAAAAYREAAWRYENLPTSIVAMLQVVQCHQRLGELEEARAALARLGWLLKKTPSSVFQGETGMSNKVFWEGLVARLERTGIN